MLGAGYTVRASMGHVRDLPTDALGIDLQHHFKPTYHLLRHKSRTLRALRAALAQADEVYLATDPDREGEAIAWHLLQVLKPKAKRVQRVTFHEITPAAIQAAFAHPTDLNMNLVNAQQARRILDRLVGYQVSPLLWRTVGGKSAGRVQSVALRLVVERERDIRHFVPQEYWTIHADLAKPADHRQHFMARLVQIGSKKVGLNQALQLKTQQEALQVITDLQGAAYHVQTVKREQKKRHPWPPFTTSTLQQAASARFKLPPAETMKIAQELYEGIVVGEGKPVGLITYMRTDSTAVAPEVQAAARELIEQKWGRAYVPVTPPSYSTKVKNAQEAHEAIRPTQVMREPQTLRACLSERQYQVYDLIWRRFVASQMAPAVYDVVTVEVEAIADRRQEQAEGTRYTFRAIGRTLLFDGFLQVWQESEARPGPEDDEPQTLPALVPGEPLDLLKLIPRQHFTEPPPRYTEATLIKALEERGIGRPSTYATILATLQGREYVVLEARCLHPTPLGETTCDALIAAFPDLMDYDFTAQMEDRLDEIARGERDWVATLHEFYGPFSVALQEAPGKMQARPASPGGPGSTRHRGEVTVGPVCPQCGAPMVERTGRYGRFWGCSRYPACAGTRRGNPAPG